MKRGGILCKAPLLSNPPDHCEEAPCIEASENNGVGSFYKTDDGIILIDYKKLEKGRPAR